MTQEEAELLETLEEQDAVQRAVSGYTCRRCSARFPKVYDKSKTGGPWPQMVNGKKKWAMRYVRCRFCRLTGKVVPTS